MSSRSITFGRISHVCILQFVLHKLISTLQVTLDIIHIKRSQILTLCVEIVMKVLVMEKYSKLKRTSYEITHARLQADVIGKATSDFARPAVAS